MIPPDESPLQGTKQHDPFRMFGHMPNFRKLLCCRGSKQKSIMSQWNISKKWGVPKEYVSCPSCGFAYGYHNRKVCVKCQECSECCSCKEPDMKNADEAVPQILDEDGE